MRQPPISRRSRGPLSILRRFRLDRTGIAATEFALVAPFLLVSYLVTFEGARGWESDAKVAGATETIGNLVTRLPSVSQTQMENIFGISSALMSPFNSDTTMAVTAVTVDANGKATVAWAKIGKRSKDNLTIADGPKAGSAYALPSDLKNEKSTFFVETIVSYDFKVMADFGNMLGDRTMTRRKIFRPRVGEQIGWTS